MTAKQREPKQVPGREWRAGLFSINKYEKILFSFLQWLTGSTERKEKESQ